MKLLIFTLLVPCSVTVWLPFYYLWPGIRLDSVELGIFALAGTVVIAFGAAGYLWCGWEFAFTGRGTPAPIDPPKVLVVRGLYRWVRNPMYISVLLVLFGESLLFRSLNLLRYAAIVWVLFHLFVLFLEEPILKDKFGASYEEYRRVVSRWIPRLRRFELPR